MKNKETVIQQEIRLAIADKFHNVRLFRNECGVAKNGDRYVTYGLSKGSPDLIGWKIVTIDETMIGKKLAQFVGLEVKTPVGKLSPLQISWLNMIEKSGGVSIVARSTEEAIDGLNGK